MDEVAGQSRLFAAPGEAVRLPVAHMVCNQTPPIGDHPSLMTFRYASLDSPSCAQFRLSSRCECLPGVDTSVYSVEVDEQAMRGFS
jgi:hypothetical protein